MVVEVAELLSVDVSLALLVGPAGDVPHHDLGQYRRFLVSLALGR